MFNWKKIILEPETTMDNAISVMDDEALKMVLVANSENKLLGTITDGDIRRALIKHLPMKTKISEIMFTEPTYCSKSDSDEKILSVMKSKDILQIPILDEEYKIVGLKTINNLMGEKNISENKFSNPVLIMAGGLGKRLLPITEETPKPLIKLGGRPIIENILIKLINSGFSNFFFATNYQAEKFEQYFKDGSDWGVSIRYLQEEKPLGTAGAIGLLPEKVHEPMLIINGDILTKINYENMLAYHEDNNVDATICVRKQDFQIPYGVVESKNNFVVDIDEKPIKSFFVNAGIYILNPNLLSKIEKNKFTDMPEFLTNQINNKLKIGMFPVHEYWLDIGNHTNLKKAEIDSLELFNDKE